MLRKYVSPIKYLKLPVQLLIKLHCILSFGWLNADSVAEWVKNKHMHIKNCSYYHADLTYSVLLWVLTQVTVIGLLVSLAKLAEEGIGWASMWAVEKMAIFYCLDGWGSKGGTACKAAVSIMLNRRIVPLRSKPSSCSDPWLTLK